MENLDILLKDSNLFINSICDAAFKSKKKDRLSIPANKHFTMLYFVKGQWHINYEHTRDLRKEENPMIELYPHEILLPITFKEAEELADKLEPPNFYAYK